MISEPYQMETVPNLSITFVLPYLSFIACAPAEKADKDITVKNKTQIFISIFSILIYLTNSYFTSTSSDPNIVAVNG